jgi:hypothetical protein
MIWGVRISSASFSKGRRESRFAGPAVAEDLRASDIGFGTVGMGDRAHGLHVSTSGAIRLAFFLVLLVIETNYLPLQCMRTD